MLHLADAQAGRELLRRLTPYVDSAADWWQAGESWISVAISYAGMVALGVPEDSLQSFPEAFRVGMAARAGQLLDYGENDPEHWDASSAAGSSTSGSASSATQSRRGAGPWRWPGSSTRVSLASTVLMTQDFGAQPGDLNPLGYKDSHRPARRSRAVASIPCPARDRRSRPASSSSVIPARPACRCRCRGPTCSDATARSPGCASTSRASGRSTASCVSTRNGAGAGAARGEAGGPLAQRRAADARAGP